MECAVLKWNGPGGSRRLGFDPVCGTKFAVSGPFQSFSSGVHVLSFVSNKVFVYIWEN